MFTNDVPRIPVKWIGKLNWRIAIRTYNTGADIQSQPSFRFSYCHSRHSNLKCYFKRLFRAFEIQRKSKPLKHTGIYDLKMQTAFIMLRGYCLNENSDLKNFQEDFDDPQSGKSICDRRAAHINIITSTIETMSQLQVNLWILSSNQISEISK